MSPRLRHFRTCAWLGASLALFACSGSLDSNLSNENALAPPGPNAGGMPGSADTPDGLPTGSDDADSATAGTGASSPSEPPAPPPPFAPVTPESALAKAKMLLTGLPPTSAEIMRVQAEPDALRELIGEWQALPEYKGKMLAYFGQAFQQVNFERTDFYDQLGFNTFRGQNAAIDAFFSSVERSFPETVWQLLEEGRPFSEVATTRRFMLTPALMLVLAFMDEHHVDDERKLSYRRVRNENFAGSFSSVTFQSENPIPLAQSLNPASPNFMTYYVPETNCAETTRVFSNGDVPRKHLEGLFGFLSPSETGGNGCNQFRTTPQLSDADLNTFKMVTIREPEPGEATTLYYDLATLRSSDELVLHTPRIGFFSTLGFFSNWATNSSNQARVTANQSLIVALGRSFDGEGTVLPLTEETLDAEHAPEGTICYACHVTLDPMRQYFRQTYSIHYNSQEDATQTSIDGAFAFGSVSEQGGGIERFAELLATNGGFAPAAVQKLCHYANNTGCSLDDPEFVRIVDTFEAGGEDFHALVAEVFSSPLTTFLERTETFNDHGMTPGIARANHWCGALAERLSIPDVCGLDASIPNSGLQNRIGRVAGTIPSDAYSRGSVEPLLISDTSLFLRSATESVCSTLAPEVVRNGDGARYNPDDIEGALDDFVSVLMGLPEGDPRHAPSRAVLEEHYNAARELENDLQSLRSTFVLACTSPTSVTIGL